MRKPKTLRRVRYTVQPKINLAGKLPMDMLRYDNSWFESSEKSPGMTVDLVVYLNPDYGNHVVKEGLLPCEGRWRSFGWQVVKKEMDRVPFSEVPYDSLPRKYKEV